MPAPGSFKKGGEANEPRPARRGRKPKTGNLKRVLVGIRVEEHIAKFIRALAILEGVPTGEFIEQLVLAAIEGQNALTDSKGRIPPVVKRKIEALKEAYSIELPRKQLLAEAAKRTSDSSSE